MAESIYRVPAKPPAAKMRRFQTLKKTYYEKWPSVTVDEKNDSCMNSEVCRTGRHSSVTGKQRFQLRGIS